jgi:hypothetical protein
MRRILLLIAVVDVHCKQYDPATRMEIVNNFRVHSCVSCGIGFAFTAIDANLYMKSSQVLSKAITSFMAAPMKVYSKLLGTRKVMRKLVVRGGAKKAQYGKAAVSMYLDVWVTIKRQMFAMPILSRGDNPVHYCEVTMDVKGRRCSINPETILEVESTLV